MGVGGWGGGGVAQKMQWNGVGAGGNDQNGNTQNNKTKVCVQKAVMC